MIGNITRRMLLERHVEVMRGLSETGLVFSRHALERCEQRGIRVIEAIRCVIQGRLTRISLESRRIQMKNIICVLSWDNEIVTVMKTQALTKRLAKTKRRLRKDAEKNEMRRYSKKRMQRYLLKKNEPLD